MRFSKIVWQKQKRMKNVCYINKMFEARDDEYDCKVTKQNNLEQLSKIKQHQQPALIKINVLAALKQRIFHFVSIFMSLPFIHWLNNILICPIYLCVPWNAIKTVINLSECWVPLRLNNRGRQLFSSAGHVTGGHLNRWKRGLKHFRNTG